VTRLRTASRFPFRLLRREQVGRLATASAVWGCLLLGVGQLILWFPIFLARPLDQDFTIWYAAARIGLTAGWSHLYDVDLQRNLIQNLQQVRVLSPLSVFMSPPLLAWLVTPFTLLPPVAGYLVWTGLSVAALALAFRLAGPRQVERPWLFALPLVAWFPVFMSLVLGQPIALVMLALALAAWLAHRGWAFAGGVVLSFAMLKPQLALLVGPALLVGGELGIGLGWVLGTSVLVALSVILVGIPGLERGLGIVRSVQVFPFNHYLTLDYLIDPVVRSGFLSASARVPAFDPVTLLPRIALGLATLILARRYRHQGPAILIALGVIGSMLVAPHLHQDDLAILLIPIWLLADRTGKSPLRFWPLIVLAAGEAPQFLTPVPLLAALLVWMFILNRPPIPNPTPRTKTTEATAAITG
jgi:Glycosyltransferase family 87